MNDETHIPLSIPSISGNAGRYLQECVESGFVSSVGQFVERFEDALAETMHFNHAVAVMNGTSAIHLALLCLGLKPEQEVLTPSLSFVATINPVRYCGSYPVLIDVDPGHWTINVERVREFLQDQCTFSNDRLINKTSKRAVAGIIPVNIFGHTSDMDALFELAEQYNLFIVEDAAESVGASHRNPPPSASRHISTVSFNGNKIITSGAGGGVLTNDQEMARLAKHLSTQAKQDPIAYDHDTIGYNYRMSNIQAALGLSQIEMLDQFLKKKKEIALSYRSGLKHLTATGKIRFQEQAEWCDPSHWLNSVIIQTENAHLGSEPIWRNVVAKLHDHGIQARPFWHPLHKLEPHRDLQVIGGTITEDLCNRGVSLPSSVSLSEAEQERVISVFSKIISEL